MWDLAHDPAELSGLDADTVRRRLYTRADELPEGETRLPIKTIHINKSPIVIGKLATLTPATVQRWGLDLPLAMRHADKAAALGRSLDPLWAQVFRRAPPAGPVDVDEDLYGGFLDNEDRRTLERLRGLSPTALASKRPAFADARLEEMLFRYRARSFNDTLTDEEQSRWQRHRSDRLHGGAGGSGGAGGAGGAFTLAAFFERVDELAEHAVERGDERAQGLLEALVDYAEGIAPEIS